MCLGDGIEGFDVNFVIGGGRTIGRIGARSDRQQQRSKPAGDRHDCHGCLQAKRVRERATDQRANAEPEQVLNNRDH